MHIDLTNEVALVTGASRGIGQAITSALGQAGAKIIGTATTPAGAAKITQTLQEQNIAGKGQVLDITESESIDTLISSLKVEMPTILVNNAAITRDNLLMRLPEADWEKVIQANLTTVYRLSKACLRAMMKARQGRIITITSVVGLTGNAGQTNYDTRFSGCIVCLSSISGQTYYTGYRYNTSLSSFHHSTKTSFR